jgi:hypothetical protein
MKRAQEQDDPRRKNEPIQQDESRQQNELSQHDESHNQEETGEHNQTLWLLAASPLIWAAHFLASYLTAAIWCAKVADYGGPLDGARLAIGVYTALALAGIGVVGWVGHRRQSFGTATNTHDFDTPADRHRFLGFATLLLSSLSAVATIFVSMAAIFMERCH